MSYSPSAIAPLRRLRIFSEIALDQGDFAAATRYAEKSAAAGGAARASLAFAELSLRTGDLESAEAHASTALSDLQEGSFNHACGLEILGETTPAPEIARARATHFRASLRSFAALRDAGGVADCLDGLSRLAVEEGDLETAGRLRGAAHGLRHESGRKPIREDVPFDPVPERAFARGEGLIVDEAVAFALGDADA